MRLEDKVFSDSLVSAGKVIFSITRGLVAIPLITNILGESSYGVWVILLSIIAITRSIGGFHLFGALIRYQDNSQEREQVYSDIVITAIATGTIVSYLFYVLMTTSIVQEWLSLESSFGRHLAILSASIVLSNILMNIHTAFLRSKEWVKLAEVVITLRMLLETLGLIIAFLYFKNLIAGLSILLLISVLFNTGLILTTHMKFVIPRPSPTNIPKYFQYGAPMVPKHISNSLFTDADKYLITYFISPTAVGIYATVYSLGYFIKNLSSVLNPTLYPTITKAWNSGEIVQIEELYKKIFRYYSIIAVPAFVGLWFLANPILELISTSRIAQEGYILFPIIGLGFLIQGYQNVLEYVLTAAEETKKIGLAVVMAATANIILNVIFIPQLELFGAALVTLFSNGLLTILVLYFVSNHIKIQFPVKPLLKAIAASAVMYVILYYLPIGDSPIEIPLNIFVGVVIYLTTIVAFRGICISELLYPYRIARSMW